MNKKNLFIVLVLVLVMVFTLVPIFTFPAQAANSTDSNTCELYDNNSVLVGTYSFDSALSAALDGYTIKLLDDITRNTSIVVTGKTNIFDVNGHILSLEVEIGHALEVGAGGEVQLLDSGTGGKFNVTKVNNNSLPATINGNGVYVHSGGKATVSNAYKTSIGNIDHRSAYATGAGSEITVLGNVDGGFYALSAYNGAIVTVHGYVSGGGAMTVSGAGTVVTVYGNSSGGGTGVFATDGAIVYVKGNVNGGNYGIYADSGAQVTVDGYVRAYTGDHVYTRVSGVNKMQEDYELESSKVGYFEYNNTVGDVTTNVWVKRFNPPLTIAVIYIYEGQIEYDNQNETGTNADKLVSGSYDATLVTAPNPAPTRDGYTFGGWFTAPDGGGIEWVFGEEGTGTVLTANNGVDIATRMLTLYANWEASSQTYTVIYEPGLHGTFSPQVTSGLIAGSATPAAPEPYGERGWRFIEWSPTVSLIVTGDAIYTAMWELNQYTVYYYPNGGAGSMPSETAVHGDDFTLSKNTFARPGYTFTGWNTTPSGGALSYPDEYTFSPWTRNDDLTLYAQ
ncbi:MAG: InlB B-repeat-containing protein, partial [Dehalococcoidia bacterium]|nr:InlB B-repeat-containing protein [Dehalococcoidia bacterium]